MTVNPVILNAILSMDAYNRGYNAGILFTAPENSVGQKVGNYTISTQSDVVANEPGVNVGFYGLTYEYNGVKIISYRGTDNSPSLTGMEDALGITAAYTLDSAGNTNKGNSTIAAAPSKTSISSYIEQH